MFLPKFFGFDEQRAGRIIADGYVIDKWKTTPCAIKSYFPSAETILSNSGPEWSILRIKTSEDIVLTLHFYEDDELKKINVAHEDRSHEKREALYNWLGRRGEYLWGKVLLDFEVETSGFEVEPRGSSVLIEYY